MKFKIIKKIYSITLAVLTMALASACTKTPVETVESPTSLIDGKYMSACSSVDVDSDGTPDGLKIAFKVENGSSYMGFLYFEHDSLCAGSYIIKKPSDGSNTTELEPTSTNIHLLTLTGVPTNFYPLSGEKNITLTDYSVVYKPDADHIYILADALTGNPGPAWSDWEAASIDVAGFAAAPTTYTPSSGGAQGGGDSSTIGLTKVSSF